MNPLILSDAELEREFARFERMAQEPHATDGMIRQELITLFKKCGYFRAPYTLKPTLLYRARKTKVKTLAEAEQEFDRVARLTYPSPEYLQYVGQGRCNNAGEAVFYCSNENGVPIFEVHPEVGNFVALSYFKKIGHGSFQFTAPLVGVREIRDNLINKGSAPHWRKQLDTDWLFFTDKNYLVKIDELITQWFLKSVDPKVDKHFYRLTTLVYKIMSENTLYGGDTVLDGLIYPSVASNVTGINIALKTNIIDSEIEFFNSVLYRVEGYDAHGHLQLRMLKRAFGYEIQNEDELIWRDINLAGGSDILTIGTDMVPKEYASFDPEEFVQKMKASGKIF